jgi:plastocyanin
MGGRICTPYMAPRARLALAGASIWLALSAASAQAATDHTVNVGGFAFSPTPVVIADGDSVTWHYVGPDTDHSITADAGQSMTFDSDPGPGLPSHTIGDTFPITFPTSGCFVYHCKVHAFMHGQVQVGTGVCPPPSSGGGGGGGGGGNGPPPPPPPPPPADTVAPAFSAVSAKGGKKLVFKLSEAGRVTIKVLRGKKTVKTFKLSGKKGSNTFRLTHRGLKHGKYKITLTATDSAGNKSPLKSVRVKI